LGRYGTRPARAPQEPWTWREAVSEGVSGCGYFTCMILMVPIVVIGLFVVYWGITGFSERVVRWVGGQPIVLGLVGVGVILFSVWGLGRVLTRGLSTGLPRRQLFGAGVVLVVIGLFGVLVLWTAVTTKPGAPGF
jgi:hypothetical protein